MVESNRKDSFDDDQSRPKTAEYRAGHKNINWATPSFAVLLVVIFLFGTYILLVKSAENNSQINNPVSVSPVPITTTFIVEFDDQSILVRCGASDYNNFDRIEWNGTIGIVKEESEFDYIKNSNNQLIIPRFYAFLNTDFRRSSMYEDTRCRTEEKFFYNLTVSGKTITNSYYIQPEDCYKIRDCGITEKLKEVVN